MKVILVFLLSLLMTSKTYASEYVMPYPGVMPGNKLYYIALIKEKIDNFLYFGDFSKFTLSLKLSDKYLIEAKTLFEYKQYLLASRALLNSDNYIKKADESLRKAQLAGDNVTLKQKLFNDAKNTHIEILEKVKESVPQEFTWTPESENSTKLTLWEEIENSIKLRLRK